MFGRSNLILTSQSLSTSRRLQSMSSFSPNGGGCVSARRVTILFNHLNYATLREVGALAQVARAPWWGVPTKTITAMASGRAHGHRRPCVFRLPALPTMSGKRILVPIPVALVARTRNIQPQRTRRHLEVPHLSLRASAPSAVNRFEKHVLIGSPNLETLHDSAGAR